MSKTVKTIDPAEPAFRFLPVHEVHESPRNPLKRFDAKQLEESAGRLERGAAIAEEPRGVETTFGTDPRKPL